MSISKIETFLLCVLSFVSSELLAAASSDSSSGSSRELDQTPAWAVAAVCIVFILISITLEKSLHRLGSWLGERQKKYLLEALEKVKVELMILGFISLLLNFGHSYIVRICVPQKLADKMLPCAHDGTNDSSRRKLLSHERRYLASDTTSSQCKEGYELLISANGLHQLHILLFFLAVFHVLYSGATMLLWRLQIRRWKAWEEEASSHGYEFSYDPSRLRLTHETSFVRAHSSFWTRTSIFFYVDCFCRQFYRSVGKADYLTLRNGFIAAHLSPGSKFNFQKYIKRSLEDDFKRVVRVSPVLWASFVVFLLLNVNVWHTLWWASLLPFIIILAVGTKLQATLTRMALEFADRHAVVQGMPLIEGSDKYFWFGRPQLFLYLIHFSLFQNAFQITHFLWIWYSFGLHNCFHPDYKFAIFKVVLGIAVLYLCSHTTLPLHALVTQMGSRMKKSIFDEQTTKALKKWHNDVKKKRKEEKLGKSSIRNVGGGSTVGLGSSKPSSGPALHRFNATGHSTRSATFVDDEDGTELDVEHESLAPMVSTTNLTVRVDRQSNEKEPHKDGTELDVELESLAPMVSTTNLTVRVDRQSLEKEPHSGEETPEVGDFPFGMSGTVEATPKKDH